MGDIFVVRVSSREYYVTVMDSRDDLAYGPFRSFEEVRVFVKKHYRGARQGIMVKGTRKKNSICFYTSYVVIDFAASKAYWRKEKICRTISKAKKAKK